MIRRSQLLPGAETVTELMQAADRDTFAVIHNRKYCFTRGMIGFDQGFDSVKPVFQGLTDSKKRLSIELINPDSKVRTADEKIADEVLKKLEKIKDNERRFFGWVFFVSPHAHYLTHWLDRPSGSPLERFHQELRFTDLQLGRILDYLEDNGLASKTIIVVTGDHGEAFRERGKVNHSSSLYDEQTRVPLVVSIPGISPTVVDDPTSSLYVFPWLLSRGSRDMRLAVDRRLRREIGPMLREIGGGVVLELLGQEIMKSALVYSDYKIIHDFRSNTDEVYRLSVDPGERRDLVAAGAEEVHEHLEKMMRYRRLRTVIGRFRMGR